MKAILFLNTDFPMPDGTVSRIIACNNPRDARDYSGMDCVDVDHIGTGVLQIPGSLVTFAFKADDNDPLYDAFVQQYANSGQNVCDLRMYGATPSPHAPAAGSSDPNAGQAAPATSAPVGT